MPAVRTGGREEGAETYCANPKCSGFLQWGVHGEYDEGVTACPRCGARLVREKPETPAAEDPVRLVAPPQPRPLVTVAAFNFRRDADLVVSMLLAHGINAVAAGDDCGRVDPGLGFATRCRVLVGAGQADAATALLEQAPEKESGGG